MHGDIKPENIFICNGHLKVADFGTSLLFSNPEKRDRGTKAYATPVHVFQKKCEDIFAFAIVTSIWIRKWDIKNYHESNYDNLLSTNWIEHVNTLKVATTYFVLDSESNLSKLSDHLFDEYLRCFEQEIDFSYEPFVLP